MSDLDPAPAAVVFDRPDPSAGDGPDVPVPIAPRRAPVGESTVVSRYFPNRQRTTVGAWCFLDHYGPEEATMRVGPHPHTGLQTVTWLLEGEVVHHDSLGHVQAIRPGQLNLMTAGSGIAHAERSPGPALLHGLQLWVALPGDVAPGFEHHADLPEVVVDGARATVLVGELAGARSAATTWSPLLGAEVAVGPHERASLPLDRGFEHAVLVVDGGVTVEGRRLETGACVYLGPGRDRLGLAGEPAGKLLLLGGEPFSRQLVMWWNFVGRTGEEVAEARADWEAGRRFGEVPAAGERLAAPPLPPGRLKPRR